MRFFSLFALTLITLSAHATIATPEQAIDAVLAKPLKLVGKYVSPFSNSGTVQSCVFRNDLVTVVYQYCTKKEAPAVGMRIYPVGAKNSFSVYAEGTGMPTEMRREEYYDVFWRLGSNINLPSYSHALTAAEHAQYEKASRAQSTCMVNYMQGLGYIEKCFAGSGFSEEEGNTWLLAAGPFWSQPTESWYELQKRMRSIVEKVK